MENKLTPLLEHFSDLKDPRTNTHNQLHSLEGILLLTILAVLCGADNWVEIEEFGKSKLESLKDTLDLPNGIPSHDTLGRVFSMLDPEQLQLGFLSWVESLANLVDEFIAVDGKTLRRAYEAGGKNAAIHMVSAWAVTNSLVFGQLRTSEKSNEITAIPELLKRLNLTDCTVSIDAMGTQTRIAEIIVEGGGDYTLSLKGNQPTMYEQVKDFYDTAQDNDFKSVTAEKFSEIDGDHGRIETRNYFLTSIPEYFFDKERWKGVKGIGYVERIREINGKITHEKSYYLLSYDSDIGRFSKSVRGHWGVENSLHWSLDVSFNEDQSRIRKGFAGENLALIRHLALNLLKQEKTLKRGIAAKRKRAGWDNNYLLKILELACPAM